MTALRCAASACILLAMATINPANAAANLIKNGTFKARSQGFTSDYALTTMTPYLFQDGVHGIYAVELAGKIAGSSADGDCTNISTDPSGKNTNVFVAAAATSAGAAIWSQTVTVTPGTEYRSSLRRGGPQCLLLQRATGRQHNGTVIGTLTASNIWQKAGFPWRSGTATTATLTITNTNTRGAYNDFAMDDLVFKAVKHERSTVCGRIGRGAAPSSVGSQG